MRLIVFDFEVFKHDTLLGMWIVDNDNKENKQFYQTWDLDEIRKLYQLFKDDIWVGHNNKFYDNHILEAIVKNKNPYEKSLSIINNSSRKSWTDIQLYSFDLNEQVQVKLKITEAYWGKKIHLSGVDFDIDRPLTESEKKETEYYNKSDVDQTLENFLHLQNTLDLKLNLINEFNLDFNVLNKSISNVAAICLGVRKNPANIVPIKPYEFPQLKLNNKELWEYYVKQKYRTEKFIFKINDVEHQIGIGGIHGARKKYFSVSDENKTIWYFDVAGYYNLLMINYDLFSRSMSKEAKDNYSYLYHEQLKLKKINPVKRQVFKIVLLSVFGATSNQYTEFYDPYHFEMITLNGQLFLVDLLEKLDPYITLIQSNTDGIIVECENKYNDKVQEIIDEWQQRTKFSLKKEKVKKIVQRDVNNYLIEMEDGKVDVKGEALKYSDVYKTPFVGTGSFNYKEPIIISIILREVLDKGELPEELIEKYKKELWLFQFICKKQTFDKLVLTKDNIDYDIDEVSRAFPSIENNNQTVYKIKKGKRMKVSGLPASVFIYNEDIRDQKIINELSKKIDWNWYINRIYERLKEFI